VFLLYRNHGQRRYGIQPISPYPRKVWQFQFILEGKCSIFVKKDGVDREERISGPVLSVSGPECVHGFGGHYGDICQVMVFHFDDVDFTVRTLVGTSGYRRLQFSADEIPGLQTLYARCNEARKTIGTVPLEAKKRAGFFEPLIYGIVANELALFFLRHISKEELGPPPNFAESKVAEALGWYEANLLKNPTAADVAKAVHVSPTHLRRLFHKIRGNSPQSVFTHVQFERVKWLMRDPSMTLHRISENSGFGSSSAFSRAFKLEFGVPPKKYRDALRNKNESPV